ncbi:hypothetical protein C8Q75DRAFT_281451 [Abortiporus biennis]|nr:hypothetical protein C8Q75DRAFT_281451 [Abortiporus biennis]
MTTTIFLARWFLFILQTNSSRPRKACVSKASIPKPRIISLLYRIRMARPAPSEPTNVQTIVGRILDLTASLLLNVGQSARIRCWMVFCTEEVTTSCDSYSESHSLT